MWYTEEEKLSFEWETGCTLRGGVLEDGRGKYVVEGHLQRASQFRCCGEW